MCPRGEGASSSSSSPLEAGETMGCSEEDIHSDIAGSLFELAPHPKKDMVKFLCDANGKQLPILGEYFGVALAFAALGALIRSSKLASSSPPISPKLSQRAELQVMLKNAMDRLQALALNAHALEQKVNDASGRDTEEEKDLLTQKLSVAEAQVASCNKRRQEDAKANEKVVGIFASYEQSWKAERKKLKQEIEQLRNEIEGMRSRSLRDGAGGDRGEGAGCDGCTSKAQELEKMEDKLCEKEFLMAAAADEARSGQLERNQLAGKLSVVELCVLDLKDRLSKETAKKNALQSTLEETESKLFCSMSDLQNAERKMETISAAKTSQSSMIANLLEELTTLQKNVGEKEEVVAVLMKRSNGDRKEKEELAQQLSLTKSKRKAVEAEKDRWKRLAEERARNVRDVPKSRRSLGSRTELEKLSELQRSHNEEIQGLRSIYITELKSLQEKVKEYEAKVASLEARIAKQRRQPKHEEKSTAANKEHVNCHELVTLLESIAPEVMDYELDSFAPEIQEVPMTIIALRDWLKRWVEAVKAQHAQQLEQRHWRELDAIERQMKLKDERLESFRWQLMNMESELSKLKSQVEEGKSSLAMAMDEKSRAERAVEVNEKELRAMMKTVVQSSEPDQLSHHDAQQRVLIFLQQELNDAQKRLEVIEAEHEKNLSRVVEEAEAELRLKDHHLAVVEAKLCQLRIQVDDNKRLSPKGIHGVVSSEEAVPDKVYKIAVAGAQEVDIKNALSSACTEVEKLADQIAEVRKQMMESDDNSSDNGLEELIAQATAVSNSGRKLSLLRNAISIEELDYTKSILFRENQTGSMGLETASQSLQGQFPSRELKSALENQQMPLQTDEASTSGAPEREVSEESIKGLDTEPEITSRSKQGEDLMGVNYSRMDQIVDDGAAADREEAPEARTSSAQKRERRKTLEEYFLDSPPELAVENAFQVPAVNAVQSVRKVVSGSSSQEILQAIDNNTLAKTTPQDKNRVLNMGRNSSRTASPLFSRTKSRRVEFTNTRQEIQVLGLALEVRKIEEELSQIDKTCASPPDVIINPRTGLGVPKATPPKRFNKRYAALTGKVGQLAKQMGLTSERSPEMVTDNPLFSKKPTTTQILSLQHRLESVSQSLAVIEAQDADLPADESTDQQTGYSKERLVDTVKAHLSQVERSLSSRIEPLAAPVLQSFIPSTTSSLKERM